MTNYEKVREFMLLFQPHMVDQPLNEELLKFKDKLLLEEVTETLQVVDELLFSIRSEDVEEVKASLREHLVKELCDVLYVTYGYGASFGIDLDKAFALVHASNMSKVGEDGIPIRREDGKILKGPNYWEPDLSGF